jgi:endo-1,4-beta-D-glucanase Y
MGCQNGGTSNGGSGGNKGGSGGSAGSSSGGSGSGGSSAKGGSGGNGSGGSGSGGTTAKGGSGGNSSGGSGSGGSSTGGNGSGGSSSGGNGSGGSSSGGNGSGGSSSGGNGSGGSSSGGNGSGGSSTGGNGSGGSSTGGSSAGGNGSGGSSTGGTGGVSTAPADMISDFESTAGKADMDKNGGRTGYWYVYFPGSGTSTTPPSGTTMTPALTNGAPITTETSDSGNALHVKGSGLTGTTNNYAGFGAAFKPHTPYDQMSDAYDVSSYTGISFKIKSGTGTLPPLFFEMLTKENQPKTSGGNLGDSTGPDNKIGLYNTRGQILYTPWSPNAISSSWQTFTVPFGNLIPRHLCDAAACPASGTGVPKCQAPAFVPTDVLGIQFSFYATEPGWPTISGATPGTFDVWIDDVAFTTDDSGLQKRTGFPRTTPVSMGSCKMPSGPSTDAKFLVPAYNAWKAAMVSGNKVIRPENGNDTVSEGIAYGMLIAVNMNDQTLFDSLYSYWHGNVAVGNLMTWCIAAGSGSCNASGGGSATDADEDAAFALLQADKAWGSTGTNNYKSLAMGMISDIWTNDIDGGGTNLPKGGSHYTSPTGTSGLGITNPSYFAPAYYTAFKAAGDSHDWASVNSAVYTALGKLAGSNGLVPAWCGSSCTVPASNGGANDMIYQYDSHRVPMRIGLDYCFNTTPDAKTYVGKTTTFFATSAFAGKDGIGRIYDIYNLNGSQLTGTPNNSASILGTAAVGAMADGSQQTFLNDAYQGVFDLVTRSTLSTLPTSTPQTTPYSYYNATVGMLTLLMMTGNFSH